MGLRYVEAADSATSQTERDSALDRAIDALIEAAVSATNAITVMPGMAVVAGDAELLLATTLLAGRLGQGATGAQQGRERLPRRSQRGSELDRLH